MCFRGVAAFAASRAAIASPENSPAPSTSTPRLSWPSSGVVALGGVGGGLMAAASTVAAVAAGEFVSTGSTRRNTSLTMTNFAFSRWKSRETRVSKDEDSSSFVSLTSQSPSCA